GGGGLGNESGGMHHTDGPELLALFLLAFNLRAVGGHLRVLAGVRAGGRLAAGVGIDLRVEDEDFDVHARGQHARERLETDVQHGAVPADHPQALLLPAKLVPARAYAHGVCRGILEEGIGPGNQIRVVRVRGGVNGVAAGGGDDADILRAGHKARGGEHHAQHRGFTAAHAGACSADVENRLRLEHEVHQRPLVDVLGRRFTDFVKEPEGAAIVVQVLLVLLNHLQGLMVAARRNAFRAALALGGVDENAEQRRGFALLLVNLVVLVRLHPHRAQAHALRLVRNGGELRLEPLDGDCLAEDCRVRAFGDALHTADTLLGDEFGDIRSNVAEVAERPGAGGNEAAGGVEVGGQGLFGRAHVVTTNYFVVEVGYVENRLFSQRYVGCHIVHPTRPRPAAPRRRWSRAGPPTLPCTRAGRPRGYRAPPARRACRNTCAGTSPLP